LDVDFFYYSLLTYISVALALLEKALLHRHNVLRVALERLRNRRTHPRALLALLGIFNPMLVDMCVSCVKQQIHRRRNVMTPWFSMPIQRRPLTSLALNVNHQIVDVRSLPFVPPVVFLNSNVSLVEHRLVIYIGVTDATTLIGGASLSVLKLITVQAGVAILSSFGNVSVELIAAAASTTDLNCFPLFVSAQSIESGVLEVNVTFQAPPCAATTSNAFTGSGFIGGMVALGIGVCCCCVCTIVLLFCVCTKTRRMQPLEAPSVYESVRESEFDETNSKKRSSVYVSETKPLPKVPESRGEVDSHHA
jgi:hypothetical protein